MGRSSRHKRGKANRNRASSGKNSKRTHDYPDRDDPRAHRERVGSVPVISSENGTLAIYNSTSETRIVLVRGNRLTEFHPLRTIDFTPPDFRDPRAAWGFTWRNGLVKNGVCLAPISSDEFAVKVALSLMPADHIEMEDEAAYAPHISTYGILPCGSSAIRLAFEEFIRS